MDAEAWGLAKTLLAEVLDMSPAERAAYLDQHCADPDLRLEVDALLRYRDEDILPPVEEK